MRIGRDIHFDNQTRLGKKGDRPRPIRVTVKSINDKKDLIQGAIKANKSLPKDSKNPRIYINPDLTPEERKIQKQLREELKTRRDNGETDLIIRDGAVIKRQGQNPAHRH